jgi:isoleucyl-tRNA synthetase
VALKMLQAVKFYPENSESFIYERAFKSHTFLAQKRLEAFVRNRSEWCISRQRPWGVPIPALYNNATGEAVMTPDTLEHIIQVLEQHGIDYWWNGPVDDFISPSLKEEYGQVSWTKGDDTMDVWFDSGTSWMGLADSLPPRIVNGACTSRTIADVCLEGSDQHRGWFQSLLLTAVGFSAKLRGTQINASDDSHTIQPYGTIITHGFVLDQEGRKMSKSLGNVISPMTIVEGGKVRRHIS